MADIAMLVAEEYERRVKNSRKSHGASATTPGANDEEIELFPHVSVSAKRVHLESSFSLLKNKIGEEKMEVLTKRVFEPKTDIADAASNCFFSA